jgi:hypothetical protein
MIVLLIMAVYLFSNGQFVPRRARFLAGLAVLFPVLYPDFGDVAMSMPDLPEGFPLWRLALLALLAIGVFGVGLLSQVYRYRYVSGPIERQQTKWILLYLATFFLIFLLGLELPSRFLDPGEWYGWGMLMLTVPAFLFPTSVAVAVLRYRLWDVDVLIKEVSGLAVWVAARVMAAARADEIVLSDAVRWFSKRVAARRRHRSWTAAPIPSKGYPASGVCTPSRPIRQTTSGAIPRQPRGVSSPTDAALRTSWAAGPRQ